MKTKAKLNITDKTRSEMISVFGTDYEQPVAVEKISRKWVTFETEDGQDFNDFLIYLYNNSSVNNAIINGVAAMIYGEGLLWTGATAQVTKAESMFKAEDVRKLAGDLKLFNKYAMFVTWNRTGSRVVKVKHAPVNNLRIAEHGGFWYSDRWDLYRKPQYKPEWFPEFGEDKKERTQVFFYQPYFPGNRFYSLPDYNGALSWINLDIEIGKFHNANIQNGLAPGMLLNFNNGEPDEQTRKEIERKVRDKWQGSNKAGKVVIAFNKTKEQAAEVTPVGVSDLDKQFSFLTEQAPLQILTGHRITSPMIFGIKSDTGLGNNAEEIQTAYMLLNETVIQPYQDQILFGINSLLTPAGLTGVSVEFIDFVPQFGSNEPEPQPEPAPQAPSEGEFASIPSDKELVDMVAGVDFEMRDELDNDWELVEAVNIETMEQCDISVYLQETAAQKRQAIIDKETTKRINENKGDARKKSRLDTEEYTLRFTYSGPAPKSTSRQFCIDMKTTHKNKVFRIEDINQMTIHAANPEFGRYSIFVWKGSYNCRHNWTAELRKRRGYTGKLPSVQSIINSDPQLRAEIAQATRTNPPVQ